MWIYLQAELTGFDGLNIGAKEEEEIKSQFRTQWFLFRDERAADFERESSTSRFCSK